MYYRHQPVENAGFDILLTSEAYDTDGNGASHHIVLGLSPEGHYVTWDATRNANGSWDFMWGHYTQDRGQAYREYHARVRERYFRDMWPSATRATINVAPHDYTPASLLQAYAELHPDKARAVELPNGVPALHLYDLGRSYFCTGWDVVDCGPNEGCDVTIHLVER